MRFYLLLPIVLLVSCMQVETDSSSDTGVDQSEAARKEIIDMEAAMNKLAVEEGFQKSLLAFADDSLIKPENGILPVIGKSALEEHFAKGEDTKAISWKPTHAGAAASGDLGYTFGNWTYSRSDTTMYGNYFTVWKRQTDGTWKWVYDGGNNTPAPQ